MTGRKGDREEREGRLRPCSSCSACCSTSPARPAPSSIAIPAPPVSAMARSSAPLRGTRLASRIDDDDADQDEVFASLPPAPRIVALAASSHPAGLRMSLAAVAAAARSSLPLSGQGASSRLNLPPRGIASNSTRFAGRLARRRPTMLETIMSATTYRLTLIHRSLDDSIRREMGLRRPDTFRLLRLKKLKLRSRTGSPRLMRRGG